MVAVALFDVLPEAFDAVGDARRVTWVVGAAFPAFFLAERALVLHHRDDEEHARAPHHVGALGSAVSISERHLGYLLAAYAGFFLFMGATDLLPEAHEDASGRRVALTVLGFAGTAGIAYAASR